MSNAVLVQYVGFEPKTLMREYTFNVREGGEEREFKLDISNEAFVSHRARYQDAPAICVVRLQAELAAHSNHPAETRYEITGAELDIFRETRLPKASRGPYGWKKSQENF
jgi:hypothetical protein